MRFPIGTKVKVINFPPPSDPANNFDYNGRIGTIKSALYVGNGLNNQPVHDYEVLFDGVEMVVTKLNLQTGRLDRSKKITQALGRFDEAFLEKGS